MRTGATQPVIYRTQGESRPTIIAMTDNRNIRRGGEITEQQRRLAELAMSIGREWDTLTRCYSLFRDEQRQRETFGTAIVQLEAGIEEMRSALEVCRSEQLRSEERSRSLEQALNQARVSLEATHSCFFALLESRGMPELPVVTVGDRPDPVTELEQLSFEPVTEPVISIVIPVYNEIPLTCACLASIHANPPSVPFEVIIADDGSTESLKKVFARVKGIRVLTGRTNRGFLATCNRGAASARGKYIVFLNNDTEVRPRALDELLDTFQRVPEAGLVGAKLLYPDGSLQEAGCIVWRGGAGWNYGKHDDPKRPEYNFLRDVDYCSAACIMIPRELFREMRGFDRRYSPAYCEDSDLAFRIRAAGKRVLYQPLAEVLHHEGASSGTDVSSGVKRFQVVNTEKFVRRWKKILGSHGKLGENARHEKERAVRKRMLVIDACVLTPDQDAGSLTAYNLLNVFQSLGYKVSFVAENLMYDEKYSADLQRIGIECLYHPYVKSIRDHLEQHGSEYDVVYMSRPGVSGDCIDSVKELCPRARVVFDTVDLHFLRESRRAEIEQDPEVFARAEELKRRELYIAGKADWTIVVSPTEREILLRENPDLNVMHVNPPREVFGRGPGFSERSGIVFIGGYQHTPNVDAAMFLAEIIMPLVLEKLPDLHLYLVGSKPTDGILALASDRVTVTGYLPDLTGQCTARRISVAPIRYGAGIKCKLLTSLGYGLPVVATSMAAEGTGFVDREEILIADEPQDFADAVVELYTNEKLWSRLARNGLDRVMASYSIAAAREQFAAILP